MSAEASADADLSLPSDVSGVSDLERRIALNIERQRADFERQARLISEVRMDVARMRVGADVAGGMSGADSNLNTSLSSIEMDTSHTSGVPNGHIGQPHATRRYEPGSAVTSAEREYGRYDESSYDAHHSSVRATLDRENITLLDASDVRKHLRSIDNLRNRIGRADEKAEALASSERESADLARKLEDAKAEHAAAMEASAQELDAITTQLNAVTQARDLARDTTAKLRSQIASMAKRQSSIDGEHEAWKQQREKQAERQLAADRRSQAEKNRLSREILTLRAEVSKHLSAQSAAKAEAEMMRGKLEGAVADATSAREAEALVRRQNAQEPIRLRAELRELQMSKMDLAGDVASLSTQLAACKDERKSFQETAALAQTELRRVRRQLEDETQAAREELNSAVRVEREKASADLAQAESTWEAKSRELREAMILAEETGARELQQAKEDGTQRLEEERRLRESERAANQAELDILARTEEEALEKLKDAHREAMRLAAEETVRSLNRVREVEDNASNLKIAAARAQRDAEDASRQCEKTRQAGEAAVKKVEDLLEESRGMYRVAKNEREELKETVKKLESELELSRSREQRLSESLVSSEAIAAEVPKLKATITKLLAVQDERDGLLEERSLILDREQESNKVAVGLKKALRKIGEERDLLERAREAQEDAAIEWRLRYEIAMNGIVPALTQKCKELAALKRVLWAYLRKESAARLGLDNLVETLLRLETIVLADEGSKAENSLPNADESGPKNVPLASGLGLLDPVVVSLLLRRGISNASAGRKGSSVNAHKGLNTSFSKERSNQDSSLTPFRSSRRFSLKSVALCVMGTVRLWRCIRRSNTVSAQPIGSTAAEHSPHCLYAIPGVGRIRIKISAIARDNQINNLSGNSSDATSKKTITRERVYAALGRLIASMSTPTPKRANSIFDSSTSNTSNVTAHSNTKDGNSVYDSSHVPLGFLHGPSVPSQQTSSSTSSSSKGSAFSGGATTGDILEALIMSNENTSRLWRNRYATPYQYVLVHSALTKLASTLLDTQKRAGAAEASIQEAHAKAAAAQEIASDAQSARIRAQRRSAALEERLRLYVEAQCNITKAPILDEEVTDNSSRTDTDVQTTLSVSSESREILPEAPAFVSVSASLFDNMRQERDALKESCELLSVKAKERNSRWKAIEDVLTSRLSKATAEAESIKVKLTETENKYLELKKLRNSERKGYSRSLDEARDSVSSLQQQLLEATSKATELEKSKESIARELSRTRVEHRKSLSEWKDRQSEILSRHRALTDSASRRQESLEAEIAAAAEKIRFAVRDAEAKERIWNQERGALLQQIERGRYRETILASSNIARETHRSSESEEDFGGKEEAPPGVQTMNTNHQESIHDVMLSAPLSLHVMDVVSKSNGISKYAKEGSAVSRPMDRGRNKKNIAAATPNKLKKKKKKTTKKVKKHDSTSGKKKPKFGKKKSTTKKTKTSKVISSRTSTRLRANKTHDPQNGSQDVSNITEIVQSVLSSETSSNKYHDSPDRQDHNNDEESEDELQGLEEMKRYIDRIDRRLYDKYGTPPRKTSPINSPWKPSNSHQVDSDHELH